MGVINGGGDIVIMGVHIVHKLCLSRMEFVGPMAVGIGIVARGESGGCGRARSAVYGVRIGGIPTSGITVVQYAGVLTAAVPAIDFGVCP